MTTKKVGPQLFSESNILVTQMANGVMKGRLGRFVFLKERALGWEKSSLDFLAGP